MNIKLANEFQQIVSGYNFITPIVHDYVLSKSTKFICEISYNNNKNFIFNQLFGVTVVHRVHKIRMFKLSKCFHSLNEALSYIDSI